MNIDWEEVASEAEVSPRLIIAQLTDRLDDIESIVTVVRFRNTTWRFDVSCGYLQALGLVSSAKLLIEQAIIEVAEDSIE